MSDFPRKYVGPQSIPTNDEGVSVMEVIDLAKSNRFFDELSEMLGLDEIVGDFININGAKKLIKSLKEEDEKFEKFDLESDFHDLEFFYGKDDKQLYISFVKIKGEKAIDIVKNSEFTCIPKYSSRNDFFDSLFSMHSFANSLDDKGFSDYVKKILYELRTIIKVGKHEKFYRILFDRKENKYYLRATISKRYNDYSNNIAVLLGLVSMHKQFKKNGEKFKIQEFSYNESFVKVSFVKEVNKKIDGVGEVKYVLEVSNDEIKREALKFVSAITIIYGKDGKDNGELYIKPNKVKWTLLSVSHGSKPSTVIETMAGLENYNEAEEKIYKDLEAIGRIKNIKTVKQVIYSRIDGSRYIKNGIKKDQMLTELNANVENLHQLFTILNKIDYLIEDVEAKDYIRSLFYDVLVGRRSNRNNAAEGTEDDI